MVTTTQNRPPTPDADALAAIAEIAAQLGEKDVEARRQIGRAVRVIGEERTRAFVAQALTVEAAGGMMLKSGSRRHTPGGLFFRLMRDDLMADAEGRQAAYRIFRTHGKRQGSSKAPRASREVPPFDWATFRAAATEAMSEPGEATTVKLTVIGRPGKIVERGDVVLVAMRSEKAPSLPKGVPDPPALPTDYILLVGRKQWSKVAAALTADPADKIIVEGYPTIAPDIDGITVHATSATTTGIQAAKRAQLAPDAHE